MMGEEEERRGGRDGGRVREKLETLVDDQSAGLRSAKDAHHQSFQTSALCFGASLFIRRPLWVEKRVA